MNQKELKKIEMGLLKEKIKLLNAFFDEEWKTVYIDNVETTYKCSNFARVINTKDGKEKELTPIRMPNGYYKVTLSIDGKVQSIYLHRLVAIHFIDIPEKYKDIPVEKLQVNHKNGYSKWNNTVVNLEWATDQDNKIHGYKNKLYKSGEDNHLAIHSKETVENICEMIEDNSLSIKQIAKITGTKEGFVYDILHKGSWTEISDRYDFSKYTPKQQKYSNQQLESMHKMISEGIRPKEISSKTGIAIKTIYYYIKKYY